jgi:hypothetical protein
MNFNWVYTGFALAIFAYADLKRAINGIKLFPLPCNGILCKWHLRMVHPTCCYCRARRRALGKMKLPPYWLEYTYKSSVKRQVVYQYVHGRVCDNGVLKGGVEATRQGKPMVVETYSTLHIDPRGHFTSFRTASIMALDRVMSLFNLFREGADGRPLSEVCELLANYPTW